MALSALPRLRELNPFVRVEAEAEALAALSDERLAEFHVLLLGDADDAQLERCSRVRAGSGALLFASGTLGMDAWFACDLGRMDYCRDGAEGTRLSREYRSLEGLLHTRWADLVGRHAALPVPFVRARLLALFRTHAQRDAHWWPSEQDVEALTHFARAQLAIQGLGEDTLRALELGALVRGGWAPATVCSVAGSLLAQAVLTAVGGRGEPVESLLVYSGVSFEARSVHVA